MVNNIQSYLKNVDKNPHWLSQQSNVTYRVVLKLCKGNTIPHTTPIGTLQAIADVFNVKVDDLYTVRRAN